MARISQRSRRRYWGRSAVVQALRTAADELSGAMTEAERPTIASPLGEKLKKVAAAIARAIEGEKIYALQGKRMRSRLEKELVNIQGLIAEVTGLAVLPEEKAVRKRNKAVEADRTYLLEG